MKRIMGGWMLGLLISTAAGASTAASASTTTGTEDAAAVQQKIIGLEAALGEAMIHKDTATLNRLVSDQWTIQSDSGVMGTKSGFVGDVQSGALVVKVFKLHDLHVTVLGDVAFVQGFDDEESSYKGAINSGTYNWLDVWQRRDGQWVSLATQLTKVKTN